MDRQRQRQIDHVDKTPESGGRSGATTAALSARFKPGYFRRATWGGERSGIDVRAGLRLGFRRCQRIENAVSGFMPDNGSISASKGRSSR